MVDGGHSQTIQTVGTKSKSSIILIGFFVWMDFLHCHSKLLVQIELSQNIYEDGRYRCNYIVIVRMKWVQRMFRDRTFFCIAKNEWGWGKNKRNSTTNEKHFRFCYVHFESQCHYSCWMKYNWVLSRILLCMTVEM